MKRREPEYVYLMRDLDSGRYKVGSSSIPSIRAKELGYTHGCRMEVLWSLRCVNTIPTERALQQRLMLYHDTHEWFYLPDDVAEWVQTLTEAKISSWYEFPITARPDRWPHGWKQHAKKLPLD